MLNFVIHNQSNERQKKLDELLREKREILTVAQAGEACYADSQGWLDTEEWAGEVSISRLEAIAGEIQKKRMLLS